LSAFLELELFPTQSRFLRVKWGRCTGKNVYPKWVI